MSLTFQYDPAVKILRMKAFGVVSLEELIAYLKGIVLDPEVGPGFVECVNFEDVEDLEIRYSDREAFSEIWQQYIEKDSWGTVLYAPSDLTYGICRMLQSILESSEVGKGGTFEVYRSREEADRAAENLLAQNRDPASEV